LAKSERFVGVDRNAVGHIAVCALDSKILKLGKRAYHVGQKYRNIRSNAQKKRKFKFLKRISNREQRIVRDINHKVSRKIVDFAKQNGASIKLENLSGIRKSKPKSKTLNRIKSNWSFYQLAMMIEYKSKLLGVDVVYVDPRNTSKTCSRCGLIGTRNRKSFSCEQCSHVDHADANAAFNIAKALGISKMPSMSRLNKDRDLFKRSTDALKEVKGPESGSDFGTQSL
jgi:putative transposase